MGKGGVFDAAGDENTVMFTSEQEPSFQRIREELEAKLADRAVGGSSSSGSSLDDLKKLAELRDEGIITEEEFAAKKKQLLKI